MNTFKVSVLTPGHKMLFKGKVVRTPVVFTKVIPSDVKLIEGQARQASLKIKIELETTLGTEKPFQDDITEEIIVDEKPDFIKKPSSILESLIEKSKE